MKLDDEQMCVIARADELTGCYSSTTEETHWLNEEEAYSLIEYLVEECEALKREKDNLKSELGVMQEQIDDLVRSDSNGRNI